MSAGRVSSGTKTHAFASCKEIATLKLLEHIEELLHEADELSGNLVIVSHVRHSLRETGLFTIPASSQVTSAFLRLGGGKSQDD